MNRRQIIAAAVAVLSGRGVQPAGAAFGADFEPAIHAAADRHGTSGAWLVDVMYAESHGDPHAYNAATGDCGLFQFQPATFATFVRLMGAGYGDVWDPWAQIDVAAWAFAAGYCDHWVTSGCWDGSPS